jgi:hypothetical protein
LGLGAGDSDLYRYVGNGRVAGKNPLGEYHIIPLGDWSAEDLAEIYRQLQFFKIQVRKNIQQVIAFRASLTVNQAAAIRKQLEGLLEILNRIAKKNQTAALAQNG